MSAATPLDFFQRNAVRYPNAPAVTIGKRKLTHAQLLAAINTTARMLAAHGVGQGSRVAIYSDDDFDLCRAYAAIWSLGATAVPFNLAYPDSTLAAMEAAIAPQLGLFSGSLVDFTARGFPMLAIDSGCDQCAELKSVYQDEEAVSVILFTSGSSGVPKAIPLTNRQVASNALSTARFLGIDSRDRLLITTPLYTTSSLVHLLTMLAVGGSIVIERGFLFGSSIVSTLEQHQCTGFGGVPANFIRLAPLTQKRAPPKRLQFLMNSGEHLPVPTIKLVRANWPTVQFFCAYGLTEVAGRLCILEPSKVDSKPGSVGQPLPGMTIKIVDEHGTEVEPGVIGQVHVSGPNLMSGYLNNTVENQAMTPIGFATGDFGRKDQEGDLFLEGRHDDIVKVGGEKVSMLAIESAACAAPEVTECAAVATADTRMGTVPWLYYVSAGQRDIGDQLKAHLRNTLPANHMPVRIVRLDELPRTSSGKVARKKLLQHT